MQIMPYSAIIFDLDGTVMPSGRHSMPSDTMCQAVRQTRNKQILCAATGRAWPNTVKVVGALGVNRPCIINGGALIVDPVKVTTIWEEALPSETVQAIHNIAKEYPYKASYAAGLAVTDELDPLDMALTDGINAFYILDIPPDHSDLPELIKKLSQIADITSSKAGAWTLPGGIDLHITSKTATKEHAVLELCNILGVDRTEVAGVGDGFNDLHLFSAVGHKIAMGNAVAELKEAADEVIGDVADDGLAHFLQSVAA